MTNINKLSGTKIAKNLNQITFIILNKQLLKSYSSIIAYTQITTY